MKIAVMPGDGIGQEVTDQAVKVLKAVVGHRLSMELVYAPVGQAGVDAAGLSEVLFGDREHVVAVRAEVCRLRKHLGAVLQTQPYRFAEGVRVVVI